MVLLGPLSGIRVVDMSRILAGPLCTMMLGDLGAEVIKLERPLSGDETRNWGPPFVGKDSTYFISFNRNKKSIAIDFRKPRGQQIIRDLVAKSDVFIENYLPGKLKSYTLDYENLKQVNPQLVYCSLTGFGQTGPMRHKPGYDVIAAGLGGFLHATGPEDGEPCRTAVAMTDFTTGLHACCSIISALFRRERSKVAALPSSNGANGQSSEQSVHIDCNLLSTQIAILSHLASSYLNCGVEAVRRGTSHESIVPYQAFKTADGLWYIVGCGTNANFVELCDLIKMPELATDARFRTNADRVKNRPVLVPILKEVFARESLKHWEQVFRNCRFPCGPINNIKNALANEQAVHNNMILNFPHPDSPSGGIRVPGPPWRVKPENFISGSHETPPALGQHTRETLRHVLDYSEQKITELFEAQVVA